AEDPSLSRFQANSPPDGRFPGEFSIGNLGPGSYIIIAKGRFDGQEVRSYERIVLRSLPYTIPPPPAYNVTLRLNPPLSLNGRLFIQDEGFDLHNVDVTLTSTDPDLPSPRTVKASRDGQFVLREIVGGSYVVDLSNLPEDLYLKAARFVDDDVLDKP